MWRALSSSAKKLIQTKNKGGSMRVFLPRFGNFELREITDSLKKRRCREKLFKELPGINEFFNQQVSNEPERSCLVSMNTKDREGQFGDHLVFWAPCYQPGWYFAIWKSQKINQQTDQDFTYHLYLVPASRRMRSLKNSAKFLRKVAHNCSQICHIKIKGKKANTYQVVEESYFYQEESKLPDKFNSIAQCLRQV